MSPADVPLHITNGDSAAAGILATGLTDKVVPWRDALHEGPVPAVGDAELRRVRAGFLPGADVAALQERDRLVDEHAGGRYVLWFEADLYDQLQLVQILARLHRLGVAPQRITLICIGEHLGIAHFGGLGELTPPGLAALPERAATPLSPAALDQATRAWDALRAPDPAALGAIARSATPELRFAGEAFDRLGREYPSTRDGLALTERRILAAVHAGAATAGESFVRSAARETRPFLGDSWCFARIARLAHAPVPLLTAGAPALDRRTSVALTDAGRAVLAGRADHVSLNGVDRWIGGVHLEGDRAAWRFDEGVEAVVAV